VIVSEFANWQDVKARVRAADPTWTSPERIERRRQMREEMVTSVMVRASLRFGCG
jgi:hypothetical protein